MEQGLLYIIDDENDILDLLAYNFRKIGFEVVPFNRAQPAWEHMHGGSRKPDVILCDWMMPEMNGLEFCRRLKQEETLSQIPFVMVTCKHEQSSISEAVAMGVSDYIVKPVRVPELLQRVADLIA